MRRFQLVQDGVRRGEGCQWTDGGMEFLLEAEDGDGGAWHSCSSPEEARKWLDGMNAQRVTIEFIDPPESPKLGKLPSERAEELLKLISEDEAKHSGLYDALEKRYRASHPSAMDMVLVTELVLLKRVIDERLGRDKA